MWQKHNPPPNEKIKTPTVCKLKKKRQVGVGDRMTLEHFGRPHSPGSATPVHRAGLGNKPSGVHSGLGRVAPGTQGDPSSGWDPQVREC